LYAVLTAAAGPLSNMIVAFLCLVIAHRFDAGSSIESFFSITAYINVMLGLFNIIPIPPLDGGHFLEALIGPYAPGGIIWLRRYGIVFIMLLFYTPLIRTTFSQWAAATFSALAACAW
jgi:Zn-dependent protease